jgi:hypothetical protein
MAAYWQTEQGEVADLMNSLPKVVVSRTLERADWTNTKRVKSDAVSEVKQLKTRAKTIYSCSGVAAYAQL